MSSTGVRITRGGRGTVGRSAPLLTLALLAGALLAPPPARAQSSVLALDGLGEGAGEATASSALARGRYAVVIDLDENRLYFRQGEVTLWSAPIGTGTGFRLEGNGEKWDFSTPQGVFHVKFKEKNPTWIAPDWYFIENKLPVPPPNDPKRFFPGGLGAAAIYIGHDLAIHGTEQPELLGQRVSHGCIRLENRYALRLFHNVQVGTEVVIVGGERARAEMAQAMKRANDPSTFRPSPRRPRPKDPLVVRWERMQAEELLRVLDEELWRDFEKTRWPEVASLLLRRGLDEGDDVALAGVLLGVLDLPDEIVEREYRTFLVDAFARRPLRTLEVMSRMSMRERSRVAEAIVAGSLTLFSGELDAPAAPWPTRKVPKTLVPSHGRRAWYALERAERDFRDGVQRREA